MKFLHDNWPSKTNSLHLKWFINFKCWELCCLFQPNFAPIYRNSMIMKFSELPWLMVKLLKCTGQPFNASLRTFNCDRTKSRWGWDRFVHWEFCGILHYTLYSFTRIAFQIPPNYPTKLIVSMQGPLYCLHDAKFKEKDNSLWTEGPLWKVSNLHSFKLI